MMSKLAVVFGGSGFLGRHVVRELCRKGWRVRIAVRRAHQALDLRVEGDVGQVQLMQCNIRSEASITAAMHNADLVVNLVGILFETGKQKFDELHAKCAGDIARIATDNGVKKLVHVSALGASEQSISDYARSKAKGEKLVRQAFADAVILRPSVLFGPGDGLFERFAAMAVLLPVLPVPGARCKMQPVYVGDVAQAVIRSVEMPQAAGKTFELGGQQVLSLRQIVAMTVSMIDRKRMIISLPKLPAEIFGFVGDVLGAVPFVTPPITSDQVRLLATDNVVADDAAGFSDLELPVQETIEAIVPAYLSRFRRYGEFHEKHPA